MNILIDFTQVTLRKAGVGVYAEQLVKHISAMKGDEVVYVLVQDDEVALDHLINLQLIKVSARWFRKLPFRFCLEQIYIPYLVRKLKLDVIHSLHYSFPVYSAHARRVVTFHDMTGLLFPAVHPRAKRWYLRIFIPLTAMRADRLIFISESTRADYLKRLDFARDKTAVIHHAVSESFTPDLPAAQVNAVREKYKIRKPYIIFIGTLEPRKNVVRLLHAYAKLVFQFPEEDLVIVGMKGWFYEQIFDTIAQLGLAGKVHFTGFVEEAEKPALLCGADLFVYPSLYEGFGIPVLEALSCGVPTITSDRSSLPEVAGDAAVLIDPTDVHQIYDAMRLMLSEEAVRNEYRARGIRQSLRFSWKAAAAATLAEYRKCQNANDG